MRIREEAMRLIERLPDDMTWEDLMYEIYVRQSIQPGLADSEAGRVMHVADVRSEFGLDS
jgi:hypothetical protein